jgi:hypothetical protein
METKVVTINYNGKTISFSTELKSKEHYEKNKKKFNDNCSLEYKRINGRPYVGSNSWLFKTLKPTNYQDFFDKYLEYNTGKSLNPNIEYDHISHLKKGEKCGRTLEDLIAIARFYKKSCSHVDYPLEDFFDDLVNHIIIETFDGHKAEKQLKYHFDSNDCKVIETDGDFDAKYGVDLVVKKGNKMSFIQVKPLSTFIGQPFPALRTDRKNFFKKQEDLDNFLGKHHEILYVLYDKDHLNKYNEVVWWKKGDKHTFKLTDLIDSEGNSLNDCWDFKHHKLTIEKHNNG